MESQTDTQRPASTALEEGKSQKGEKKPIPIIRDAEQEDGPYAKMISHEQETPVLIRPPASINGKELRNKKAVMTDDDEDDDPYMHMIAHDDPGERKELEAAKKSAPAPEEEDTEDGPYARMMAHEDLRNQVRRLSASDVEPLPKKARTVIRNAEHEDGPYASMIAHEDRSKDVIVKEKISKAKDDGSKPKKVIRNAEQEDGPYATLIAGHDDSKQ